MFDEEVAAVIQSLDAGFPRVEEMTGPEARAAIAARRQPVRNPDVVAKTEDRRIPGPGGELPVRLYFPHHDGDGALPVVVFCHGGGFVFCDLESHDGFCRELSARTESVVISVDYRLAPEHRAPAAAHDAYAALTWAAENARELGGDPDRLLIAGDSAGGNLAASACLLARDAGGPGVAAQVLIYPALDPACDSASYRERGSGYGNTKAAMEWYWRQYLPADGAVEPRYQVEPLAADTFRGLPPAIVVTAGLDPLSDDGRAYAAALARDGVAVTHRHYPGLFHGFLTIMPLQAGQSARDLLWHDLRAAAKRGAP
ncbi:acetyl esterase [Saccharopolyspora antimicrobica]|uniref:Acetyl esterase n=1 Tax=Saccharopolyspora antimicrobica TaxID=455193 RepID=A0A1I4VY59_9PSEU|nr:alpha/beta hydrolase [Saccharopolyspora antimicrobica]RKT87165.1 acetyl esterase [Saccharopolyspora antimicrobica]SFN05899.1 acetyl esterase [Saccharopolyspora antimicrobica]